jgi:large subunit ribosomal protein L10
MENPRPAKVAVVDEVRQRLDGADAAVLTEYRGLRVSELAALRRALKPVGGDYKVYKNTLVRLAVTGGRHDALAPLLEGPTAIAFVSGEVSAVAKALRDYARTNPNLVVKGGLYAEGFLSSQDLTRLADLPSREVLLAQLAGAIAAPLRQFAGLVQALPRNLAYGLAALVEQRGGARPAPPDEAPPGAAADDSASTEPEAGATAVPAEAEAGPAEADATADAGPAAGAASPEAASDNPAPEADDVPTES